MCHVIGSGMGEHAHLASLFSALNLERKAGYPQIFFFSRMKVAVGVVLVIKGNQWP